MEIEIEDQTLIKTEGWPIVLSDDEGLRDILPGECFYCHQKIGQPHGKECVCVLAINFYRVRENISYRTGIGATNETWREVGTWKHIDPYFWGHYDCEFHKNEGSYCMDNAIEYIDWSNSEAKERAEARAAEGSNDCNCGPLEVQWIGTIDNGPFIVKKTPSKEGEV